jgi:hypothetical protein
MKRDAAPIGAGDTAFAYRSVVGEAGHRFLPDTAPDRWQGVCLRLAVRPEGANHQWRKIPPRELSIDLEADERLGRVTGRAGAS